MPSAVIDFPTWNPHLRFDVMNNPALSEEMTRRTLNFKYTDNARQYDEIEWELDNRDGFLTRPEILALGIVVRVRLGYQAYTTGWKAFVISRVKGGVGIYGKENPADSEKNSTVTLYGRNRNAPDYKAKGKGKGKGKRKQSYSPDRSTGRGHNSLNRRKRGLPTQDVIQLETLYRKDPLYEDLTDTSQRRVFNVRQTSDAVKEIARQIGFPDDRIIVEDTNDSHDSVIVPDGITVGDWLESTRADLDWVYKIKRNEFHFHSSVYKGAADITAHTFDFAADPNILDMTLDWDFRLPIPGTVKAVSHDPIWRVTHFHEERIPGNKNTTVVADVIWHNDQRQSLLYDMKFLAPGADLMLASKQAKANFIASHVRVMQMDLEIVGNPSVLASDTITITGTGSPFADRMWYVETAVHVFEGSGSYKTTLECQARPHKKGPGTSRYYKVDNKEKNPGSGRTIVATHIVHEDSATFSLLGRR